MIPYLVAGGSCEHRPVRGVVLLGSRALSHLSTCSSPLGNLRSRRPSNGGGNYVGAGIDRVPSAGIDSRDARARAACVSDSDPVLRAFPVTGPCQSARGIFCERRFLDSILRYRHFRRCVQMAMLLLAVAVAVDGFLGPQVAPLNLAGVLPWTHWRGLAVIALLMAGNLFCMACPFTLPRDLARKFVAPRYQWPRQLRSKWIAAGLLAALLVGV